MPSRSKLFYVKTGSYV